MKLYELKNAMLDTLDIFLESEQKEIDKENYELVMEYLKGELEGKGSNTMKYIRNLMSEVNTVKEEVERLDKLRKQKENKVETLKNYVKNILISLDTVKVETELGAYSLRKSSSIEILNIEEIPRKFVEIKKTKIPDKRAIAEYFKKGKEIKGARVLEGYSLQIR